MNTISSTVNNAFTALTNRVGKRPVSMAAAGAFLGTSIYVAHEGLQVILPGTLGQALTACFVAVATLQWLALGRHDACVEAKDFDRADAVIQQAWMFGIIETVLYALGGLALALKDGMDVNNNLGIVTAVAGAALFAFANFRVKWVSCDQVGKQAPSNGGQRVHDAFFDAPALPALESEPADWSQDATVISFGDRMRQKDQREVAINTALAEAPPVRDTATRLRLSAKRLRMRASREGKRIAA